METRIVGAEEGLDEAVSLIKSGELVVIPTETVYGLGADALNPAAVKKIFEAKGRPQDNPLIVHISRVEQVKTIAREVPDEFYALAERFMPGPLTVVLEKSDAVPYEVTAGGHTVAVRMPNNAIVRRLIAASSPIAAPSANRSKHVSPTTAAHVYDDLKGRVSLILDGGECVVGIESTVLDLTTDIPTVLRPGAVTADMIAEVLGAVSSAGKIIGVAKSPGMKYEHYAPTVPAVAAYDEDKAFARYDEEVRAGGRPVLIMRERHRAAAGERAFISLGDTPEECMRRIYAALRKAEREYTFVIVEALSGKGAEGSVMNRIMKSVGGKLL